MDYEKKYKEAIERLKQWDREHPNGYSIQERDEFIFPELKESEDERIRKEMIETLKKEAHDFPASVIAEKSNSWIAWIEKKCEQKPAMIQWEGDNLKEVIDFTGKDKNFEKWFKSFDEYEKYVGDHNGIFKLFNEDGSHYEVPVGAWIVKTPDGYNVASKAVLVRKPAEWSEEDGENSKNILYILNQLKGNAIYSEDKIAEKCIDWLKSLRPQNTWKPSDEQMQTLYRYTEQNSYDGAVLTSLYNDIKKLK